jgi:serine/threonine protein kinase
LVLFGFMVCKEALFANTWAGSKSTMAPEINNGQEYTQSVDIYSAGVIYYELVTGKKINLRDTAHNYAIRDQ